MRRKKLGKSGVDISEIAFGGVEIGVPYGIGVHSAEDMLAERDAIALLHEANDRGINFFDTARLYGESERIMGRAFADRRDKVVLASKCRHFRQEDGKLISPAEVKGFVHDSLKESLSQLKTDYIDLYMVHYADREIFGMEEVASVFSSLKEKGIVRTIGVSVYKPEETEIAISSGVWDAIQLPFNLMDQSHGVHFPKAQERGVGVIVRSVLMRGMLTDRLKKLHPALEDVEQHIQQYRTMADDAGFDGLPQFATQFALSHDAVSSVLVGIDKVAYLEDAIASASGMYLNNELLAQVQKMGYPRPELLNLAEWDKKGWI